MRNYQHLCVKEREIIYDLIILKRKKIGEIAKVLNRSRSTIYREIKRNGNFYNRYRPFDAHRKSRLRQLDKSRKGLRLSSSNKEYISLLLHKYRLSAESIVYFLKLKFDLVISKETIYRYIIHDQNKGGSLFRYLPKYKRRKRRLRKEVRGKVKTYFPKKRIEERPLSCTNRVELGHLEADLIIGSGKEVILTMIDRKGRFLVTKKLPSKEKRHVFKGIKELMPKFGYEIKTITADNGTEFHCYKEVEEVLNVKFYFAHPYHSWEKGSIENANGLLRVYLSKGVGFEYISSQTLNAITKLINLIPRKKLGNLSAYENIKQPDKKNIIKELNSVLSVFRKNKFEVPLTPS